MPEAYQPEPAMPSPDVRFPFGADDIKDYSGDSVHPVQRAVFERLRDLVLDRSRGAACYANLDASLDGTLINADAFRDLSPEYQTGVLRPDEAEIVARDVPGACVNDRRWVRTWLTSATTGPSAAASRYWAEREAILNRETGNSMLVAFGGSGSGKTRAMEDLGKLRSRFDLVYDTTLTNSDHAFRLAEAYPDGDDQSKILFLFVLTDFRTAVERMIKRAKGDGRYIPISGMVENHRLSRETLIAIIRKYGHRERIGILVAETVEGDGPRLIGVPENDGSALLLPQNAKDIGYAALLQRRDGLTDDLYRRLAR